MKGAARWMGRVLPAALAAGMLWCMPAAASTNGVTGDEAVSWVRELLGKGVDYGKDQSYESTELVMYYYTHLGAARPTAAASSYASLGLPEGWTYVYEDYQRGDIGVWIPNYTCRETFSDGTWEEYNVTSAGHVGVITEVDDDDVHFSAVSQGHNGTRYCTEDEYLTVALQCAIRPNFPDNVTVEEPEESIVINDVYTGAGTYQYFVEDCTWTEAFSKAVGMGGHLVYIETRQEYYDILKDINSRGYTKVHFFIGGRRDVSDSDYFWADEDNVLFGTCLSDDDYWASTEWLPGEPSLTDPNNNTIEQYLDIFYYETLGRWVWNDVPDDILAVVPSYSGRIGYIVEWD